MERPSQRTGRRLAAAFVAILFLFGAALAVTLVALHRIGDAEANVDQLDRAKHAGQLAAAQIREQHIQQAHALLTFDEEHLRHYDEAEAATRVAITRVTQLVTAAGDRELVRRLADVATASDRLFRESVIPALRAGDRARSVELAGELARIVDGVAPVSSELDTSIERRSEAAGARAVALRDQASIAMITCFSIAFVLAVVVSTLLTRSIVRPLAALSEGAQRIGRGDLARRVEVRGDDELAQLAASFNQMATDLAKHQDALVRSQKLASIGQVAAGIAHEINNPLAVILGYVKLMRRAAGAHDDKELQIVEAEAAQCQRIVQELLDLARPQHIQSSACELGELARAAVTSLDEAGVLRGCAVTMPDAGSHVVVRGDPGKLRQVICNLVLNAVEASSTNAAISIAVARDGDAGVIDVGDHGPGIPPDVLPHVFDPFFTTKREGTGLGLPIVQAIVEAHGGRIDIQSSPGGTRVRARLPLAPEDGTAS